MTDHLLDDLIDAQFRMEKEAGNRHKTYHMPRSCICVDDDGERTVCVRVPQRGMWMQRFEPGPWLGEISDQLV